MAKRDTESPRWFKHQRRATALLEEYAKDGQEKHLAAASREIVKALKLDEKA